MVGLETMMRMCAWGGLVVAAVVAAGVCRAEPVVIGRGAGLFQVGRQLARDDFANLRSWEVQLEEKEGFPEARVEVRGGTLDCLVPGRGCTVWFKQPLRTRVTITYEVRCPVADPAVKGVEPKDVNQFWLASDPENPGGGLFDSGRYTGDFGTYSKMNGYYASTGGGRNTTTRMRRYPREVEGKPVEHIALTDKDKREGFLITPGKPMRVQLVAYDDLIQYIVDGRLVYEAAFGDTVQVERRDGKGRKVMGEAVYAGETFPIHERGFFGFRMVGTHHVYSNFVVHELVPQEEPQAGGAPAAGGGSAAE